jgi:hypothetical protein
MTVLTVFEDIKQKVTTKLESMGIQPYEAVFGAAIIILILILVLRPAPKNYGDETARISNLTDRWLTAVSVERSAEKTSALFCPDATLLGTVSQRIRTGSSIMSYFQYFTSLPNIRVISRSYTIQLIDDGNIAINSAIVRWHWDGLDAPIDARMTFIFSGDCIAQLHSSVMPERNDALKQQSPITPPVISLNVTVPAYSSAASVPPGIMTPTMFGSPGVA